MSIAALATRRMDRDLPRMVPAPMANVATDHVASPAAASIVRGLSSFAAYIPIEAIAVYALVHAAVPGELPPWIFGAFIASIPLLTWLVHAVARVEAGFAMPLRPSSLPIWEALSESIAFAAWASTLGDTPLVATQWLHDHGQGIAFAAGALGLPTIEFGLDHRRRRDARATESALRQTHRRARLGDDDFILAELLNRAHVADEPWVPLLVEVPGHDWRPPYGVCVTGRLGSIVGVQATREGLRELDEDAAVQRTAFSRDAGVLECQRSVPAVRGNQIHGLPFHETGGRALIAVIDSGVDILHHAFRDAAGRSRIIGVWDQAGLQGPSPRAAGVDPELAYGRWYGELEIARLMGELSPPTPLRDPRGHGTHVASIAAGRACPSFSGGMAPDARLLVVIPHLRATPEAPLSLGYSRAHVEALQLIRSFAVRRGLPVVVNVSQGMNAGAHDGTSLLEHAFDTFTGLGRDPGFVVVKSAGNGGDKGGHAHVTAQLDGRVTIEWRGSGAPRPVTYLEAWFSSHNDLRFVLDGPRNEKSNPVTVEDPEFTGDRPDHKVAMTLIRHHEDNGDSCLRIVITAKSGRPVPSGPWQLHIVGRRVAADSPDVHMWVEHDDVPAVKFSATSGDTSALTLSIPGTARHVITVGALEGLPPELTMLKASSRGPTRDPRVHKKPDLAAPGHQITAAGSVPTGVRVESGTSMAAPHVAGAVALVLSRQRRRALPLSNAAQITAALRATARPSASWNSGYGLGCLDAEALMRRLCP